MGGQGGGTSRNLGATNSCQQDVRLAQQQEVAAKDTGDAFCCHSRGEEGDTFCCRVCLRGCSILWLCLQPAGSSHVLALSATALPSCVVCLQHPSAANARVVRI